MKISDLDSTGEVSPDNYCEKCHQPFGDLWKHSRVCKVKVMKYVC